MGRRRRPISQFTLTPTHHFDRNATGAQWRNLLSLTTPLSYVEFTTIPAPCAGNLLAFKSEISFVPLAPAGHGLRSPANPPSRSAPDREMADPSHPGRRRCTSA